MRSAPIREIDTRYWIPALSLAVLVVATLIWVTVDFELGRQEAQDQAVADWRRRLAQIRNLLEWQTWETADSQAGNYLLTLFSEAPGLNSLAAIDADGRILHANRRDLPGRLATELPGIDARMLSPQRPGGRGGIIRVDADGHLRGYYPVMLKQRAAGLLYLDVDTARPLASAREQLLRQTGIFAAIVFTGLVGGVFFTRRYVNRPIAAITRSVQEFRPGEPMTPIPLAGSGPLCRLAREFERGARALNDNIAEIKRRGQRLDRILESIGDAVIITDAEGCIERLNPTAEALTGWPRADACGRGISEVFSPFNALDHSPLPNPALHALATGKAAAPANHAAIVSRQGTQYQIADTAAPIRTAEGSLDGAVLVFRDVTEAYRQREEQRIAAVAFDTGAPQLVADRDGRIIRVNPACLRLGGYSREEMLGFHLIGDVFIGQESPGLGEFLAGNSAADVWAGPTWWRRKNGERVHLWVTDSILRDAQGQILHYVISAIDTTEMVRSADALAETRDNYQHLIQTIHDGVGIIQNQFFVDCNAALADMLGRPRTEILGRTVTELSLPRQADGSDSTARALALFDEVVAHGEGRTDWHMLRADGRPVLFEATLSKILWQGAQALLAVTRDITERRAHDQERQRLLATIEHREQLMRLACTAYGIATWEIDVASGAITWAQGAEAVLGLGRDRLPNTYADAESLLPRDDRLAYATRMRDAVANCGAFGIEFTAVVPGVGSRWFRSQGECRTDPDGTKRVRGAIADITAQRQAQQDIEQLAFHDALTGLANRRLFLDRLQQANRQTQRSGQWGAVLFVDLDRFKLLNDSLGHATGDILLTEVAQRCEEAVREADTVARLGGDEFVILVTDLGDRAETATRHAEQIAGKLHARLDAAYRLGGHDYHLTASVGIALFPRDGQDAEELLRHADVAMYQVKQRGRDAVAFYESSLQARTDQRLTLERELRQAIERGELCLYFQPKVDAAGTVVGAEALLRWQHPQRGLVPPLDFIAIAEETGLIFPIGKQVMRQACAQIQQWQTRCPDRPLTLAVNVSPHQFRHPDFLPCVTSAVHDFAIMRNRLIIEITEGTMLESIDLVIARMRDLKHLGVDLAVDDFGTGYSSLYYLKNLPLDEIKIDQSYVRDLLDDANDAAIVESIIAIAHNLKLRTVAEGVETAEQAQALRALGCLVHQGYWYSRPLPLADFEIFAGL